MELIIEFIQFLFVEKEGDLKKDGESKEYRSKYNQ